MSNNESNGSPESKSSAPQVTQVTQRRGNTSTRRVRARGWVFTMNNPTDTKIKRMEAFMLKADKYCAQIEIGKDKKTPHIQGCIRFKNAISFETVKEELSKCHIEKCKDWNASVEYCQKEETRAGKQWFKNVRRNIKPIDYYDKKQETKWQKRIIDIVTGPVDRRKIFWFFSEQGGVGKSTLARHLVLKHGCVFLAGENKDAIYACTNIVKNKGFLPPVVIDIPKNMGNKVSYDAIESIKNGMWFNTKYESEPIITNPAHIIIFANSAPDCSQLSADRWEIISIEQEQ